MLYVRNNLKQNPENMRGFQPHKPPKFRRGGGEMVGVVNLLCSRTIVI